MTFRQACEIAWNERLDPIDGVACDVCKRGLTRDQAQFHHIVLRSQGGKDDPENIAVTCYPCHEREHGRPNPEVLPRAAAQ